MVKDYKITTTVNKELYLRLRGKLMMGGLSFSGWLETQMKEYSPDPTRPQVTTVTKGPIHEGGATYHTSTGEVSLGNEFHPVPKGLVPKGKKK